MYCLMRMRKDITKTTIRMVKIYMAKLFAQASGWGTGENMGNDDRKEIVNGENDDIINNTKP